MRVFWFTNGSPQAWQEAVQASDQARQSMPLKTGSAARLPGLPLGQGSRWRGQQKSIPSNENNLSPLNQFD